jgi:hypothetical protein
MARRNRPKALQKIAFDFSYSSCHGVSSSSWSPKELEEMLDCFALRQLLSLGWVLLKVL